MSEPDRTPGEIAELRARLERAEQAAAVRSTYRRRRADRRARERQARIRRRARVAGDLAAARAEVAESGEARAEQVRGTQRLALCLLLPVMTAFGAWSTAGVQAGMVAMLALDPDGPAARAAWAVEPALLGTVAAVILLRARLQAAGGDLDERATYIEFGALALSIVLNMAGHWPTEWTGAAVAALAGHALGPIGAAGAAYLIAVVQDGVHHADPWTLPDGTRAPSLADRAQNDEDQDEQEEERPAAPRWVPVPAGARRLLSVECAEHARARARALAEGAAAVAQIEQWRAQAAAAGRHERMRATALTAAAGGSARALPAREHTVSDQRSARRAQVTARVPEQTEQRVLPAVEPSTRPAASARRAQGQTTRERVRAHQAEHPEHTAEQIAEALGVHPSTVRRHRRAQG